MRAAWAPSAWSTSPPGRTAANGLYVTYVLDQHKGYATAEHLEAVGRLGPCEIHRRSFRAVGVFFQGNAWSVVGPRTFDSGGNCIRGGLHAFPKAQTCFMMKTGEPSHRETGLSAILSKPWAYDLFSNLVGKRRTRVRLVQDYIRPFSGCRILEIGCGTAGILSYLPDSIGEYTGFDMNPSYIESARERWKGRTNCRFLCHRVEDAAILENGHYDVVLAIGIVHHLDDDEATHLFRIAHRALQPRGALITWDNVYIENQNWFAKWLISRDRGRAVRTTEGYTGLAAPYFDIESTVVHDALRIPYTIFIMRCVKSSS